MNKTELLYLATNGTLNELLDELERDAFEEFMRAPKWLRWRQTDRQKMAWMQIEAVRTLRARIKTRAQSTREPKPVV